MPIFLLFFESASSVLIYPADLSQPHWTGKRHARDHIRLLLILDGKMELTLDTGGKNDCQEG
jgi:hypothetical protein